MSQGSPSTEISNVARPGHCSRHNLKYWQGGSWHGFGCGAHSTVDGIRWKNVSSTEDYVSRVSDGLSPRIEQHALTPEQRLEERLFTGLRLSAGISRTEIEAAYGTDPWRRHEDDLRRFAEAGLLWNDADRFGLTRGGMLVANEILATFL